MRGKITLTATPKYIFFIAVDSQMHQFTNRKEEGLINHELFYRKKIQKAQT
jgi:hypothetical protein